MFFDDAGFILRYLDQLKHGYWFQYNPGEGAVFGISGFIHGLYASILVKLGMHAERALHFSNLTGLFLCILFLQGIFYRLLGQRFLAYLGAASVILLSKTYCDVLFTGMETPLHIALILGAWYFYLSRQKSWFFLFAALSVISKLDAVPVVGMMMLVYGLSEWKDFGFGGVAANNRKPKVFFFLIPLVLWVVFAFWFFGSPFPQSAKAKVLYHSGAHTHWFPFLEGFLSDIYKKPLLILWMVFFFIHLLLIRKTQGRSVTDYWMFGWMFVGIMVLYYFYNPNERMLWYYALPDLLLVAQCILSSLWLASLSKDVKGYLLPIFSLFFWFMHLMPDVQGARFWMFSYLEKVERERLEVGKYIAREADSQQKLLAWHGLLARPFPGYVLDGTGLNSPLAVEFKLNRDSMIAGIKPDYAIHHAYDKIVESFEQAGYSVKGVFGDVTLENWPAWIWWKRETDPRYRYVTKNLADSSVAAGEIVHASHPLKVEGKRIEFQFPYQPGEQAKLWFAFEGRNMEEGRKIQIKVWRDSIQVGDDFVSIPAFGNSEYPSLYTFGTYVNLPEFNDSLNFSLFRVEFLPCGADSVVKINNPLLERRVLILNPRNVE